MLVVLIACASRWRGGAALAAPARVALDAPSALTRRVARLEKPPRLPVWPVLNGLACAALDLVGASDAAAALEARLGGRVAPMMLRPEADPFVLLVHHRHGFDAWDPVRPLFEALLGLPEGFPAHPHRGFETVTATLRGGLRHRDSVGVKETYGDGDVQWLTAGRGVLHEEMWWWDAREGARGECELYQLWVNLPASVARGAPATAVLRAADLRTTAAGGATEVALDGGAADLADGAPRGTGPARGDVLLRRVTLAPGATYARRVPARATVVLYARRGAVTLGGEDAVPRHGLAYTWRGAEKLDVANASADDDAEILLLVGMPIDEPVSASGTWVVSSQRELAEADADYAAGRLGRPWPHTLADDEWRAWVADHPPSV